MDIKVMQNDLLLLLKDFDDICKKNQIQYTLHGGTLLGAIREKGFIPWDDDVDIAMTRNNFTKLDNLLKNNNKYYIFGKIKKQFRNKNSKHLWIDIFVCDYISENKVLKNMKLTCLTILDFMNRDKKTITLSNFTIYNPKQKYLVLFIYYIGKIFPSNFKIYLYNTISEFSFQGYKTLMIRSNDQYKGRKETFPSKWMKSFIYIPFETIKLPVIVNYHDILLKCYGKNYMTPIKDTRNNSIHNQIRSREGVEI